MVWAFHIILVKTPVNYFLPATTSRVKDVIVVSSNASISCSIINSESILCHWSLSIPPENIRKVWFFQGVQKETIGKKWVHPLVPDVH